MTWTYTLADPLSTKDWIRLRIGDTDATDPYLQDEEIESLLSELSGSGAGNRYRVAAACAEAIAGKVSRQADKAIGPLRLAASQRAKSYLALAKELRRNLWRDGITPTAGGISVSDKEAAVADTDRVQPMFTRDMVTAPGTSTGALPNVAEEVLDAIGFDA